MSREKRKEERKGLEAEGGESIQKKFLSGSLEERDSHAVLEHEPWIRSGRKHLLKGELGATGNGDPGEDCCLGGSTWMLPGKSAPVLEC